LLDGFGELRGDLAEVGIRTPYGAHAASLAHPVELGNRFHNARVGIVDNARLHHRLREDRLDRVGEAGESVDAGDEDVLDAAVLEL
jgi:hypothetical protein